MITSLLDGKMRLGFGRRGDDVVRSGQPLRRCSWRPLSMPGRFVFGAASPGQGWSAASGRWAPTSRGPHVDGDLILENGAVGPRHQRALPRRFDRQTLYAYDYFLGTGASQANRRVFFDDAHRLRPAPRRRDGRCRPQLVGGDLRGRGWNRRPLLRPVVIPRGIDAGEPAAGELRCSSARPRIPGFSPRRAV